MAAVPIHVVTIAFLAVDQNGNVINKCDCSTTIAQVMRTSHQHVVLPDTTVPNSADYPTVPRFLQLEAADGYVLRHMSQNMIVLYQTSP